MDVELGTSEEWATSEAVLDEASTAETAGNPIAGIEGEVDAAEGSAFDELEPAAQRFTWKDANEAAKIARNDTRIARELGEQGEKDAGLGRIPKVRINSISKTADYRIPDELSTESLTEVKNVARQGLTNQLRDFYEYAKQKGVPMRLIVRENTKLSGPLRDLIESDEEGIVLERILRRR